jgi:hypothetical protein
MDDSADPLPADRYNQHQVSVVCPKIETAFGGELQFSSLHFDIHRNGLLCRKHLECYSDSLWTFLRDLYNTLV